MSPPPGGDVGGAGFLSVDVRLLGGRWVVPHRLDAARLESAPIALTMKGIEAVPGFNLRLFVHPFAPPPNEAESRLPVVGSAGPAWQATLHGVRVAPTRAEAQVVSLGVFGLRETPGALQIVRIEPTQVYAAGGANVTVSVNSCPSALWPEIGFDGVKGEVIRAETHSGTAQFLVRTPPARRLAEAAASSRVDVRVALPQARRVSETAIWFDVLPGALAYVGPRVTGVAPAEGPQRGGTRVTVRGAGFLPPFSVRLGAASLANVEEVGAFVLEGETRPHAAGTVDVTVTNGNNYVGVAREAFTYLLEEATEAVEAEAAMDPTSSR